MLLLLLLGADVTQAAAQSPSEADRWTNCHWVAVIGTGPATEAARSCARPAGGAVPVVALKPYQLVQFSLFWLFFLLACVSNQRAALLMLMYDIITLR